jgi:hypothetical protein
MQVLQNAYKIDTSHYGRPTVMTTKVLHKLELAFCIDASDREACAFTGISEKTLYNYLRQNPDFLQQKQAWKSATIFEARRTLAEGVKKDPKLALKYLERKRPQEFGCPSVRRRYEPKEKYKPVKIIYKNHVASN